LLAITPLILAKTNKEVTKEYYDLNCDGVKELVYVSTTVKETKKIKVVTKEYYDEYWDYLGVEEWINDELVIDTFKANDPGYCPECKTDADCSTIWKCIGNIYYYQPKSCTNGKCSYGDWTGDTGPIGLGYCSLSVLNCGAQCDSDDDCKKQGFDVCIEDCTCA